MDRDAMRAWLKRTGHDLIHGEQVEAREAGEEVEGEVEKAERDLEHDARRALRARIALAIVALSIFSAVAGWRASVFDERSSSSNAVFHQDLVLQQQLETQHEANVGRDITQYGQLEQRWYMAVRQRNDASTPGAAPGLAQAAERESVASDQLLNSFEISTPQPYDDGTVAWPSPPPGANWTINPGAAYRYDVSNDLRLEGLHPASAQRSSDSESAQAVDMTGVAALFIAGLFLFTLAQVALGRRTRAQQAAVIGRWTSSHTFVLAGTVVAITAAVLFVLVMAQ